MMDSKNASMGMGMSVGDDGNVHDVMAEWFDICRSLAASSHAMPYAPMGRRQDGSPDGWYGMTSTGNQDS